MRAAAILGLGCSQKELRPFQSDASVEWRMGMPGSGDEVDVVLLFGGDGTIHRHLGQLVRLGLPVLVVPVGSGNDFARALGMRRVRDAVEAWRRFCGGARSVRAIDLGVIFALDPGGTAGSSRYFCCVAGVGLDGEVAARANRLPRWLRGHGGYFLSLAPTIMTFAAVPMKILSAAQGDQNRWDVRSEQPTLLAAFANTPLYGGGMRIAPRASMDDGLLDVCVVGAVDRLRLMRLAPTVYSGRHLELPEVEYFQSARLRVETEQLLDVYADGEYVCQTPVEVGAERGALRVVTVSEGPRC